MDDVHVRGAKGGTIIRMQTHKTVGPRQASSHETKDTREEADARVEQRRRPYLLYVLMAATFFQGISGIIGGVGLLMDPTGESLGIPQAWLSGSPFADYTLPGIVLLLLLGILPLIAFFGLLTGKKWGLFAALYVGIALLAWLFVEILVIGYQSQPPLQLIYGILGVAILALALAPSVRHHFGMG
jgi:hypothetical protein